MSRILVTDCESRKALCIVRNLGNLNHNIICISKKKFNLSKYSKFCEKFIKINKDFNVNDLNALIDKENIDFVIPMEDDTVEMISRDVSSLNAKTLVPDIEVFKIARNKALTMENAKKNNVNIPHTYNVNNKNTIKDIDFNFPVLVKPKIGAGSKGLKVCYSTTEVKSTMLDLQKQGLDPLVQQYINSECRKIQVLVLFDKNHNINRSCVYEGLREFPVSGGPVTLWKTVNHRHIENITIEWLKNENWVGFAEVEFLYDEIKNEYYLMEINPRFSANIALAHFVGINLAEQFVNLSNECTDQYKRNELYDYYCQWLFPGDFLNYIFNKNRKNEKISYFFNKPINTRDAIFSKNDLLPGVVLLFTTIFNIESIRALISKLKVK